MWYNILFFAAGIAVDIAYNYAKRIEADHAYKAGFKHAKREDERYRDGVYDEMKRHANENGRVLISDEFMSELHDNGHATVKLR